MSSKWQNFLNSLATPGGAIFILLFLVMATDGGAFTVYFRHDLSFQGLSTVLTGSGGFASALLFGLKSSESKIAPPTPPEQPKQ